MNTKDTIEKRHDEIVSALKAGHHCTLNGRKVSIWNGCQLALTVNTGRGKAFAWLQNADLENVQIED